MAGLSLSKEWVDIRDLEERGRRAIETGLADTREAMARHLLEPAALPSGTLFLNVDAYATISAAIGEEPSWVRVCTAEWPRSRRLTIPPRGWWDPFTVALRVDNVSSVDYVGAPFLYHVSLYFFKPHDLLDHAPRSGGLDKPPEAADWVSVLVPPVVGIPNLPSCSPRHLARELLRAWLRTGRERMLPWIPTSQKGVGGNGGQAKANS